MDSVFQVDEFVLIIKEECWDATLTGSTFVSATYSVNLWTPVTIDFNDMADNLGDCGGYTYELRASTDQPGGVTPSNFDSTDFVMDDTNSRVTFTPDTKTWIGVWKFYIVGQAGTFNSVDS